MFGCSPRCVATPQLPSITDRRAFVWKGLSPFWSRLLSGALATALRRRATRASAAGWAQRPRRQSGGTTKDTQARTESSPIPFRGARLNTPISLLGFGGLG